MNEREQSFFRKVKAAIFSNPFSRHRREIDLELTGMPEESTNQKILQKLLREVQQRINKYRSDGGKFGSGLTKEDRQLLQFGVLFYLYHRYSNVYDDFIAQQIKTEDRLLKVEFAE
ncbi:MAG: hypothetical protein GY705_04560, partial [Bacteroidetes bacterium]|nr:hypothetical protein [Bacteroidota bacterium]